ncbi:MAG: multiple sugar transport system permease protein [Rhodospirillaceae bacterium]|nr:multiple sugar transport system permease protein [Rhodospirillaceae bacterium]
MSRPSLLFRPPRLGALSPAAALLIYGLLAGWTLVVLFPLYWLVITSFKLPIDVAYPPKYLPFLDFQPSLHAWRYLFIDLGNDTLRPYFNSLIVATTSTLLSVAIGSMAAYALSRIEYRPKLGSIIAFIAILAATALAVMFWRIPWWIAAATGLALFLLLLRALGSRLRRHLGNGDILFWIISQRILPPVVAALPIYVMFQQLGLLDTRFALIVTYMTVNLPIAVWLMYDFFAAVPRDLEESAQLDGASRYRIFLQIVLPLAKPGLIATFLLVLILAWNEYLLALFLSTAKAQTMPILVSAQNGTRGPQWGYMSAIIVIMIAPVVALTVATQKYIARGLLLGAIKG